MLDSKDIPVKLLTRLRRQVLHKHPEVSGYEGRTSERITNFLRSYRPNRIITGLGGHGVAAIFTRHNSGPNILIRCELDALPIMETNTFAHRSVVNGVSHKCGHDGHAAIVAGLATILSKQRSSLGQVTLLFQPAEETGEGAAAVLGDWKFKTLKPDFVFAVHNLPGYPLNAVVIRDGNFTAAVKTLTLELVGKTAHAAEPEFGLNPALAVSRIIAGACKLSQPDTKRPDFHLITPVYLQLGHDNSYGTSAGHGVVKLTIRCWTRKTMKDITTKVMKMVKEIAASEKLKLSTRWEQEFEPNTNHPDAIKLVRNAAKENDIKVVERAFPFKWGEDFGLFTQNYKGAMFGIGAGKNHPALHNPDYDFPDELIPTGVRMFHSIITQIQR